jgi:stage III sporulation protein SpoIIIAA
MNVDQTLAREAILNSSLNLLIVGKAGTGKTTFLREVVRQCKKKLAVVAPSGIAAIEAEGRTIHSF